MKVAALVGLILLLAACGGSEEEAEGPDLPPPSLGYGWVEGDCDPAGSHDGVLYRLCFDGEGSGTIERLKNGRRETLRVEPPDRDSGHWRWAALSPDGTTFLAQWSAECEIPFTFLVSADGGTPQLVTGEERLADAPESVGLGWTTGGDPIVRLPKRGCGRAAPEPGTYVFADGEQRPVDVQVPSLAARDVG